MAQHDRPAGRHGWRPRPGLGPLNAAAALHAACFPGEPWSAESLTQLASQPGALAWHCLAGDSLAGFLLARLVVAEAEILTLAVDPAFRRQEMATSLVVSARAFLQHCQARTLFLEASASNQAARALYGGLGFRLVGIRPAYYPDGSDALVFRLDLGR